MAVNYDMSRIDKMEGHEFERFVASLLRKLNYQKVEVTPGSGDQGVDVLAEKDGVRYAIQCKCYSSDLGNTPVQEINTGKTIYRCHVGIVVTNRYFTQGAREAAKATGVLLWDRTKLEQLIAQVEMGSDVEPAGQQKEGHLALWTGSPLLRRGGIALKDREWKKASQFFDRVLNTDPENAEAYLGLVLAEAELPDENKLVSISQTEFSRLNRNNLRHAEEFAGPELKAWFASLDIHREKYQAKIEATRKELEEECKRREEKEHSRKAAEQKEIIPKLPEIRKRLAPAAGLLAATSDFVVGVQVDGTVVAVGNEEKGWGNIGSWLHGWTDIVSVACGPFHIVGLTTGGTVRAIHNPRYRNEGECCVEHWQDIIAIACGHEHTVGLKSDGSVVAAGNIRWGGCDVGDWRNITAIACTNDQTVGLKSDGTVVATRKFSAYVKNWNNIVAIACGDNYIIGLKADGTAVIVGNSAYLEFYNDCVASWEYIVAVFCGDGWKIGIPYNKLDIVAVAGGSNLKADGTVTFAGYIDDSKRQQIKAWRLFNSIDTLEQERTVARHHRLETEHNTLQTELVNLKGLFTGKRRREIKARLKEVEQELAKLTDS